MAENYARQELRSVSSSQKGETTGWCSKMADIAYPRMFEHSKAHRVDLKDTWVDWPALTSDLSISVDFSEADSEHIKLDSDGMVHQAQAIQQLQNYHLWGHGQIFHLSTSVIGNLDFSMNWLYSVQGA